MKRKSITLLLGVVVIGGLTGSYFYLKSCNERAEEAALEETSGEEILNVDSGKLNKVSFYINGEEETFYLENEQWKLERDRSFPVDASSVLTPIAQLEPLLAVRVLEDVEDISEYGLDEPQNVITLTDTDGQVTTVTLGDTNSGTGNDYLMLNDEKTVIYTIEDTLRTAFFDDLYDYAYSDEMPVLMVSGMTGVSVETGDSGYELYLEDAVWMTADLSKETGMEADSDAVNDAMSSLGGLAYTDYVEYNCTDNELYGFEETDTVLTICYQAEVGEETEGDSGAEEAGEQSEMASEETETEVLKEQKSVRFKIGTTDSLGNYYVQMEGSAEVHTLSSEVLENFLGKTAADWEAQEQETEEETAEALENVIQKETEI